MKLRLLSLLVCPSCGGAFEPISFDDPVHPEEIREGLLRCRGGCVYPIVETIPRIVDDAFALFPDFARHHAEPLARAGVHASTRMTRVRQDPIRRTRESFGYQWTRFSEMVIDFRENFLHYIHPLDAAFFPGKLGIDIGCGFGRHIYHGATFGAEMVGVDLSRAIDVTRRNTQHIPNIHLVQANVYQLPFRPGSFDFAYSIGVLHHLPDPEAGFQQLATLTKSGGTVFIWVYSKTRRLTNAILEGVRRLTTRLPREAQVLLTYLCALFDWGVFIAPYNAALRLPGLGSLVRRIAPARVKVYSAYPFQVVCADWFDRLAAPIRHYYDARDLEGWLNRAQLERTRVSPTGLYGWRAYGERP